MIADQKVALLYSGTLYRKTTSTHAVELVNAKPSCVYFFDDELSANRFILVYNKPPICPLLYDLSDTFFDNVFCYERFNVDETYRFKTRFKIGEGFHAVVYSLNCNWVIRKSRHNFDGFLACYHITDKYRKRLMLPLVDRVQSDVNAGVIFVEKLYRINPRIFDDIWSVAAVMSDPLFYMKKFVLRDHIDKKHLLYPVVYTVLLIYRYLRKKGYSTTIDLNPENIMARANGEFVLNDVIGVILNPFSYRIKEIK